MTESRDRHLRDALTRIFHRDEGVQYWCRRPDGDTTYVTLGLAHRRPPARVVPSTTFHCFSTTKPITALAVLQLAARERVDLDAPLADVLPELPQRNGATVAQVLSHQAGLPNPLPLSWVHRAADHDDFDGGAFLDRVLREHPRADPPGRRARYSNVGFLLLGRLIEKVGGTRYVDWMKREILDVVGTTHGDGWLDFTTPPDRHATGYLKRLSALGTMIALMPDPLRLRHREGAWVRYDPFYLDGAPYGGLVGNAMGWAPLLTAIAKCDERLLPSAWYPRYFAEQTLASGRPSGHAMSWFVGRCGRHDFLTHAGGGPGYGAEVRVYPALGAASALLCNTTIVTDRRMLDTLDAIWLP